MNRNDIIIIEHNIMKTIINYFTKKLTLKGKFNHSRLPGKIVWLLRISWYNCQFS